MYGSVADMYGSFVEMREAVLLALHLARKMKCATFKFLRVVEFYYRICCGTLYDGECFTPRFRQSEH